MNNLPFLAYFHKENLDIRLKEMLSPIKYFNQRLLSYTQIFASDPDYIFYALSVTQQQKLNSQINVALRKVCSGLMTAGILSNNFSETVQALLAKGLQIYE